MHKSKGNAIPFEGAANEGYVLTDKDGKQERHPPMGADVLRWLFCRHNPANNINFGPGPAEELRSQFLLKFWNSYAFFCNYARLDKFDPQAPQVPVKERPDIDRWILSDLQLLIQRAHAELAAYNVQDFCLEAERFVDDRLSNWYVRRNRRRFWKSEQGADKLAAYQTLYTVLVTLAKLFAPVMPFLSEAIYQNLACKKSGKSAGSVHWEDFPGADETLIDAPLSADMAALLRLVSLGSAVRNTVKIKVRQPLAELVIQPANDAERRAIERFVDQIAEELNIKNIRIHDASRGPLLRVEVKPNPKNLGPKLGAHMKTALQAILPPQDDEDASRRFLSSLPLIVSLPDGEEVQLTQDDFFTAYKGPEGWAGLADRATQVCLDARISEELAFEGSAREIVRHVQNARKDAGLEMEDRILLYLRSETTKLAKAIQVHVAYVCQETLAVELSAKPLTADGVYATKLKIDGQELVIQLKKR
jgi:isoleucyl-tRNA synthetase